MSTHFVISQISSPPADFQRLLDESLAEGFRLLQRLKDDWQSGDNRFSLPGEALSEMRRRGRLIGICGLNRDPYTDDVSVGRIRRLYISVSERRMGAGRRLVEHVLHHARGRFKTVRLRAGASEAGQFYAALGFSTTPNQTHATHSIRIP